MTKIDQVKKHLKKHKVITSWDAISSFRYTRLADGILKLKATGWHIQTVMKKGKDCHYAEYHLISHP